MRRDGMEYDPEIGSGKVEQDWDRVKARVQKRSEKRKETKAKKGRTERKPTRQREIQEAMGRTV